MGLFGLFKKRQKSLIVADDGIRIWGIVADQGGVRVEHQFPLNTEIEKVLSYGREQGAGGALFLRVNDVRELEVKLGSDLDPEDRREAIEYAAASSLGDVGGTTQRVSYLDGMLHDMRSGILVSYFETDEILSLEKKVQDADLKFLGVSNFKQFMLAEHFSDVDHHECAFLMFLHGQGFVATAERGRFSVRNLPFGAPEEDDDLDEWKEKAERRLGVLLRHEYVALYGPAVTKELGGAIKEMCDCADVELIPWEVSMNDAAVFFLKTGRTVLHPVLPPPKAKDPKFPGTVIGLFMLIATVLSLGGLMCWNVYVKYKFEHELEANKERNSVVIAESKKLEETEKNLAFAQEKFHVYKRQERISQNYLIVMNLLSRYHLKYTRVTSIEERSTGIHLQGESYWQPDLSKFFRHLDEELSKHGLGLFSDSLSEDKKTGKLVFASHIAVRSDK